MTDRQKLIHLISRLLASPMEICRKDVGALLTAGTMADFLIANGVTVPKKGHWVVRSSGKGAFATNWVECSECLTCGSPQWKVCPVCETRMVNEND